MPPLPLCSHRLSSARGPLYTQWHLSVAPRKSNRAPTGHRRPRALFQAQRCCERVCATQKRTARPRCSISPPPAANRFLSRGRLAPPPSLSASTLGHSLSHCLWLLQPRLRVNYRWPVHTLAAQLLCVDLCLTLWLQGIPLHPPGAAYTGIHW